MSDAKYFTTTKEGEIFQLKSELNSDKKEKRREAVEKVIASMTVGNDVSALFPDVINCMQTETDNLKLKKLVYLYLINYAKTQPDLAILAVNTFVKDCDDPNPLIRALAVRTMGCIRVDKITEYLCDPLRKCLKDEDPCVRMTGAVCVAKLYDINPTLAEDQGFLEALKDLLPDSNPMACDDPNPLIHALAVRTMGCIRVDKITEYLCDPLRKCLKDEDPDVRKTAAVCVAKLYDINPTLAEDQGFLEALKDLLSDSNPMLLHPGSQRPVSFNAAREQVTIEALLPSQHSEIATYRIRMMLQYLGCVFVMQSYISLIAMMSWSVIYHSWMTFVFLLCAIFLCLMPSSRALYAEILLMAQFVFSLDTEEETNSVESRSYVDFKAIGFDRGPNPVFDLAIQSLFVLFFWTTLRLFMRERQALQQASEENGYGVNLDDATQTNASIASPASDYALLDSGTHNRLRLIGRSLRILMIKFWIVLCGAMLLLISMQGKVGIYRIVYMALLLCFVVMLQLHYFHKHFLYITSKQNGQYKLPSIQIENQPADMAKPSGFFLRYLKFIYKSPHLLLEFGWRLLDIHILKVCLFTIFLAAVLDVSAVNLIFILLLAISLMAYNGVAVVAQSSSGIAAVLVIVKMIYQLRMLKEESFTANCTWANASNFNRTDNDWVGLCKVPDTAHELRVYISVILIVTLRAIIVPRHRYSAESMPVNQLPKSGIVFPGIERKDADVGLVMCMQYLWNYGFYRFGLEICFVTMVINTCIRLDVFAVMYGILLLVMFMLGRRALARIWGVYVVVLGLLLPLQYLLVLGIPRGLCITYPWDRVLKGRGFIRPARMLLRLLLLGLVIGAAQSQQWSGVSGKSRFQYETGKSVLMSTNACYTLPSRTDGYRSCKITSGKEFLRCEGDGRIVSLARTGQAVVEQDEMIDGRLVTRTIHVDISEVASYKVLVVDAQLPDVAVGRSFVANVIYFDEGGRVFDAVSSRLYFETNVENEDFLEVSYSGNDGDNTFLVRCAKKGSTLLKVRDSTRRELFPDAIQINCVAPGRSKSTRPPPDANAAHDEPAIPRARSSSYSPYGLLDPRFIGAVFVTVVLVFCVAWFCTPVANPGGNPAGPGPLAQHVQNINPVEQQDLPPPQLFPEPDDEQEPPHPLPEPGQLPLPLNEQHAGGPDAGPPAADDDKEDLSEGPAPMALHPPDAQPEPVPQEPQVPGDQDPERELDALNRSADLIVPIVTKKRAASAAAKGQAGIQPVGRTRAVQSKPMVSAPELSAEESSSDSDELVDENSSPQATKSQEMFWIKTKGGAERPPTKREIDKAILKARVLATYDQGRLDKPKLSQLNVAIKFEIDKVTVWRYLRARQKDLEKIGEIQGKKQETYDEEEMYKQVDYLLLGGGRMTKRTFLTSWKDIDVKNESNVFALRTDIRDIEVIRKKLRASRIFTVNVRDNGGSSRLYWSLKMAMGAWVLGWIKINSYKSGHTILLKSRVPGVYDGVLAIFRATLPSPEN